MTRWIHNGHAWIDTYTTTCGSCMITRHPQKDRGEYVIWIDGERIAQRSTLELAKWKAENTMEGLKA